MPEISRFYGITIYIFFREHEPPHFHAVYGEHEALIDIQTLGILCGHLPVRSFRFGCGMGRTAPAGIETSLELRKKS